MITTDRELFDKLRELLVERLPGPSGGPGAGDTCYFRLLQAAPLEFDRAFVREVIDDLELQMTAAVDRAEERLPAHRMLLRILAKFACIQRGDIELTTTPVLALGEAIDELHRTLLPDSEE